MIRCARRRMHGRETGDESGLNDTRPQRPPAMRTSEIIRLTAIATLTVIAIVALLLFFVEIRSILLWVLIGIILAIALQPAVGWLERHRWNRILASLLVSFATIAVIAAAVVAIAWPVVGQSDVFIRDLPRLVTSLFGRGGDLHFLEVRLNVIERLRSVTPGQVAKRRPRQPAVHRQRRDQGGVRPRCDHHRPDHHGDAAHRGSARLGVDPRFPRRRRTPLGGAHRRELSARHGRLRARQPGHQPRRRRIVVHRAQDPRGALRGDAGRPRRHPRHHPPGRAPRSAR